ncbi:MAG: transcriptional activator NhaR [Pseudomonadales bacterium]|nr:transcriptional activator NhaR [Pseudomonadales bacterium]
MSQLNYHHLYYFYVIAREGSIVNASKKLHLTPQTVSGQLSAFEDYLGTQLFDRKGKRLLLNATGKLTFSYAEDIFALGNELQHALHSSEVGQQVIFTVGVTDVIPKVFTFDLLKTCFEIDESIRLVCREGDLDSLLADLAISRVDIVISDRQLTPGSPIKAYSHLLGETGLTFYADKRSSRKLSKNFPQSLDQESFLICGDKSNQKHNLLSWFETLQISPKIVAEFDDSALMKFFGQAGFGVFCTPSTIEQHIIQQYNVSTIGRTEDVGERFYAISPERKLKHPGVKHLVEAAKRMFEVGSTV